MNSLSIEINWIFNFMSKTYRGLSEKKANITHAWQTQITNEIETNKQTFLARLSELRFCGLILLS